MMQTKPPLDEPRLLVAVVPAGVCASKGWGDQDHGFTTVGMLFFSSETSPDSRTPSRGPEVGFGVYGVRWVCVCVCACVTRQA